MLPFLFGTRQIADCERMEVQYVNMVQFLIKIVLFDRKEIQDAQPIANFPRTARGKAALKLGGSLSSNEEPWRQMLQHGRGSESISNLKLISRITASRATCTRQGHFCATHQRWQGRIPIRRFFLAS